MTSTEELERLLAEATSLPWSVSNTRSPANVYAHVVSEDMYIADCEWDSKFGPDNAALIVAAVNALPELVARVKRYEAALNFYAAREHYNDDPLPNNMWKTAKAVFDGGKRARAALNQEGGQ